MWAFVAVLWGVWTIVPQGALLVFLPPPWLFDLQIGFPGLQVNHPSDVLGNELLLLPGVPKRLLGG